MAFCWDALSLEDLQSAWLLVHCAAARANFFLRSVTPGQTSTFASHHDDQMWAINPASVTHSSRIGATLKLHLGGLGLSSAVRLRCAAHWAKLGGLHSDGSPEAPHRGPHYPKKLLTAQTAQGVVSSIHSLHTAGFVILRQPILPGVMTIKSGSVSAIC